MFVAVLTEVCGRLGWLSRYLAVVTLPLTAPLCSLTQETGAIKCLFAFCFVNFCLYPVMHAMSY